MIGGEATLTWISLGAPNWRIRFKSTRIVGYFYRAFFSPKNCNRSHPVNIFELGCDFLDNR